MKIVKTGNARVKIYKSESGGYDLFTVVHYRDGKRIRENFRKERDATSRAQHIAMAIEKGRVEVLQLTNSDRESYLAAVTCADFLSARLGFDSGSAIGWR